MTNTSQAPVDYKYRTCMEEVVTLIKARVPYIWIVTHEERRLIAELSSVLKNIKRTMYLWSANQGLLKENEFKSAATASGSMAGTQDPRKCLSVILSQEASTGSQVGAVYVMRDFHIALAEPVPRQLRDIYLHVQESGKTIIFVSPMLAHGPGGTKDGLPPTMEKEIHVVNFTLPTPTQTRALLVNAIEEFNEASPEQPISMNPALIQEQVRALGGLTKIEMEDSIAASIAHLKNINTDRLIDDKKKVLRKSQVLEFIETHSTLDDIGGLDNAKTYLSKYARAYSDEAQEFGVEPLRGVLFVGVPGAGKSAFVKTIANLWKLPLLRLDIGKVMGSLVGASESRMREVISQAESCAPAILWIDEVEKSLAGTKSSNFSDGGTLARVFGTLLTAMQEGMAGITLIATANDISLLPPEFIRRFNEVFFVDLPSPEERWDIFAIHLRKRKRSISSIAAQKDAILEASQDYTGAEIEKAIKDAIARTFYENRSALTPTDVLDALKDTKPIAHIMADKISDMREKARGQYRFASSHSVKRAKKKTATITSDMDGALDSLTETIKSKKEKASDSDHGSRFSNINE